MSKTVVFRGFLAIPVMLIALGLVIGAFVPFAVELEAQVEDITLPATHRVQGIDRELEPDSTAILAPGETLLVSDLGTLQVVFDDLGARATLIGPVRWTYTQGERHATLFGHALDRETDYRLVFKQRSGVVRYDFSEAPQDYIEIELDLPDGTYQPAHTCWEVAVIGVESRITSLECR